MKILITGSSGLIGSSLSRALQLIGIEVDGYDVKNPHDQERHANILDENLLFSRAFDVDGIIHLAAVSRVIDGERNPSLCWETNVRGTQNVTQVALSVPKKPWIIYASSREVYGEPKQLPVPESATLKPVNIYGESKLKAEQVVQNARSKGLISSILRFSNVYGSILDHPDRVIPAFCRASAEGLPIRVDGSLNTFDFTYIEDVVQGVISVINLLVTKQESLPTLHFTRGVGMTLGEIAQIAKEASSYPLSIHEHPSRSFDVSRFFGDTTLAKQILKWEACVNAREGMQRLINQYLLSIESHKPCQAVEVIHA